MNRSRRRLLLLAILLTAWAWRLYGLDAQSLWRDEVDSLIFATRPLAQVLANFTRPGENGPLYFLLLRPWLLLVGQSAYALRFPSALMGVLAVALLYVWGRRLFSPTLGLVAALLLAVNPYHLWYSQEAKMYALLVVMTLAALWAFAQALARGKAWRWLVWLILTSACFYIHVLGVFVIPLQLVWFLLTPRWRSAWRGYVLALAALILPYIPLIWWQWKLLANPNFRTGHPFVPFDRMLLTTWGAQLQGIPPVPTPWLFAAPIFLLLAAIFLPTTSPRPRRLLLSWWLLPILGVFLISLRSPIFTDRYLIWTLPALVLMLALGLGAVYRQNRWLAGILLAALLVFQLWMGWRQTAAPIKSDFRAAAAYIAPQRQAGDLTLFLMPYIQHTYRYYDPGDYAWAEAPYANRDPDATLLPARLADLTRGYTGVWLVESEPEFYDEKGLIRSWLQAASHGYEEAHFARVNVYYFRWQ